MRGVVTVLALVLLFGTGPLAAQDEAAWSGEFSLAGGHNDNFFNRASSVPAPSSYLVNLGARVNYEREVGNGELELRLEGREILVLDIDNADYELISFTTRYKLGRVRADLRFQQGINLLFSEEADPAFFDIDQLRLRVRYSINDRFWVRGEVEVEDWNFDAQNNDRDSDIVQLGITVRAALSDSVALRLTVSDEDRDARTPDNSRTGAGYALSLEVVPVEDSSLFLRLRRRNREYGDAPLGDRNFQRDDTLYDLVLNFRWFFNDRWGAQLAGAFRDAESTRADRIYSSSQIAIGMLYRWGSKD